MIRLLTLASLPLLLPGLSAGDDEQEAANELRMYDLGVLELGEFDVNYRDRDAFLPYAQEIDRVDLHTEGDDGDKGEHFVRLLNELYGAEFEYEGRMLDITEGGTLLVVGPEALHARVEALHSFYEKAINSQAVLRFDVLNLRAVDGGPGTAVLDVAAADALVAQAASRQTFDVAVRADRTAMLDLSRSVPMVLDYDVEIAQASAISDPIVRHVPHGIRVHLQAAPVEGGLALAMTWKHGELVSDNVRELGLGVYVNTESGKPQIVEDVSFIQGYSLANRSVGFGCVLPEGKVLALTAATDAARGGVNEVVLVRQVGGGLAARAELALSQSGAKLVLADTGAAILPSVRATGTMLFPNMVHQGQPQTYLNSVMLTSAMHRNDSGLVFDMLSRGGVAYTAIEEIGRWAVVHPFAFLDADSSADAAREQEAALAMLDALAADTTQFAVEVTVFDGRTRVAQTRLPLRNGTGAALTLGMESVHVDEYDVEVAQFSAVPDPQVDVYLDGVALWVQPTLTARGSLQLEVRGAASLLVESREIDLGTELYRFIDQPDVRHVAVNQRRDVAAGADGAWTTTFGDTGGEGVQLRLRITRL